ncbi:MAG: hypothetical protein A4E42_01801 [Methanoregulaceae archaeon PtaU1.Bin222]|nr:MAG: hypothetical protein A4E42_01801 [Methanoregulaceae archaeon PtaU1.Bin222]
MMWSKSASPGSFQVQRMRFGWKVAFTRPVTASGGVIPGVTTIPLLITKLSNATTTSSSAKA